MNIWPFKSKTKKLADSPVVHKTDSSLVPRIAQNHPFFNAATGAGTTLDKSIQSQFLSVYLRKDVIEQFYSHSWAAKKMIDIPVDDMFVRGRQWTGDDENAIKTMMEYEQKYESMKALSNAMKSGRLFGTALLIIVEKNKELDTPLEIESIRFGDLAHFWVVDRWLVDIASWVIDPRMERYGQPYIYNISPRIAHQTQIPVHHSRVLRFDGQSPPVSEGWSYSTFERDWGVSELVYAFDEILRDASTSANVSQLISEASLFVMRVQGLKEAIKGRPEPGEATIEQIASTTSSLKSIYRTMFIDSEDEAERVSVSFSGLPELMDRHALRLAAIAGIPATRFLGRSPVGMNATGESDMANYSIRVSAMQEKMLTHPLKIIDAVVARSAGLPEPPEYEWQPLHVTSEKEQAESSKLNTDSIMAAYMGGLIDEDEARERLSKDQLWGELGPIDGAFRERIEEEKAAEREGETQNAVN